MRPKDPQPHWWMLFLLLPIYGLLAWIFTQLAPAGTLSGIAQFASILLVFYLAYHWIMDNEAALLKTDREELASAPQEKEDEHVAAAPRKNYDAILRQAGKSLAATGIVLAATLLMALIGRSLLGEEVIALLYLAPIGWTTVRWGRVAGASAALSAALCFDFFFIPPYHTFIIGNLESWLLLLLFMVTSIVVVGRVMTLFAQVRDREREKTFLYDLVAMLPGTPTREEIAAFVVNGLLTYFEATSVRVILFQRSDQPSVMKMQNEIGAEAARKLPERTLPLYSETELIGKIIIAQARIPLPADDDPLLQSICRLVALAIDNAQTAPSRGLVNQAADSGIV